MMVGRLELVHAIQELLQSDLYLCHTLSFGHIHLPLVLEMLCSALSCVHQALGAHSTVHLVYKVSVGRIWEPPPNPLKFPFPVLRCFLDLASKASTLTLLGFVAFFALHKSFWSAFTCRQVCSQHDTADDVQLMFMFLVL
jgi:hypothetical protein